MEDRERVVKPGEILETTYIMSQSKVMVDLALTTELQMACEQNHIH